MESSKEKINTSSEEVIITKEILIVEEKDVGNESQSVEIIDLVKEKAKAAELKEERIRKRREEKAERKRKRDEIREENKKRKREEKEIMDKELLEQRYKSLNNLLAKSQFYSQYFLQKIDTQKEQKNSKPRRKRQKRDDNGNKENAGGLENIENTGSSNSSSQGSSGSLDSSGNNLLTKSKFYSVGNRRRSSRSGPLNMLNEKTLADSANAKEAEVKEEISRETQPVLLVNGHMRSYQLDGFSWLKNLFENGQNGILADEMGLGKTIQTIAMLCHLVSERVQGPFLVVAPLSTLPNWIAEFKRFAPKIPTLLYHGNDVARKEMRPLINKKVKLPGTSFSCCPVVITSYDVTIRDARQLQTVMWRYLAVDEGHRLKNYNSILARTLRGFSTTNRLILTGTPLQNNLAELWSLLNFLLPDIFESLDAFESWFEIDDMMEEGAEDRIVKQEMDKQIVGTLHKILSPFLLRRLKVDVDLEIPGKKELLVYVPMTKLQLDLYKATITRDFSAFEDIKKPEAKIEYNENGRPIRKVKQVMDLSVLWDDEDEPSEEAFEKFLEEAVKDPMKPTLAMVEKIRTSEVRLNLRNIMMQCRKIVNHPYLLQYPLTPEGEYKIDEDLLKQCGKLQVLDQVLSELKRRGHRVLLFSQMTKLLNVLEDYLSLRPQFRYKRLDGTVQLEDRSNDISEFNENDDYFLYLLSTRAGGLGINLTSADTVIIYDSDWNPQQDLQAQDRCHRIGQTKPVLILRLVAASTVDQRIVERASAKRKLEKVIMKGNFKTGRQDQMIVEDMFDPGELLKLLQSRDHQRIHNASTGNGIFTQDEMDQLLDRSDLINNGDDVSNGNAKTGLEGVFKIIPEDRNVGI